MSTHDGPLLILGVGNQLLGDDGVGLHVVDEIRRLAARGDVALPPGTSLVDGGTRGLDLLADVSGARAIVLVDAAQLGAAPGTVRVISGDAIGTSRTRRMPGSSTGVTELVDVARFTGRLPDAVSLVGIQPASIAPGIDLSVPVGASLDDAVRVTLREARLLDGRTRSATTRPAGERGNVGALA